MRQALALAIDRKQIAETGAQRGLRRPRTTSTPPTLPWSVPGVLKTDVAGAKKLLDDAGWRPGPDGIRVKDGKRLAFEWLHYPQQPDSKPMSEAIQAQLKAVGVELRLKQVDDITAAFRSKDFDAGVTFNSMQKAGNPMRVLNTYFRTDSLRNWGGWGSAGAGRADQAPQRGVRRRPAQRPAEAGAGASSGRTCRSPSPSAATGRRPLNDGLRRTTCRPTTSTTTSSPRTPPRPGGDDGAGRDPDGGADGW